MLGLVLTAIAGLLLFDFLYFGNFYSFFGVYFPTREIFYKYRVFEGTLLWSSTEVKGKFTETHINKRMGYRTVVFTDTCMFFKNTSRTYIFKIDLEDIRYFSVGKKLFKKVVIIHDTNSNKTTLMPCCTKKWVVVLEELGIDQK